MPNIAQKCQRAVVRQKLDAAQFPIDKTSLYVQVQPQNWPLRLRTSQKQPGI